jgi:hypothetical protein
MWPGTPFWRLKTLMDAWCALWFWPLDKAGLLDGSDGIYERLKDNVLDSAPPAPADVEAPDPDPAGFPQSWEAASLFGETPVQIPINQPKSRPKSPRKPARVERRSVIPLADLDDWLDFAEALLGTDDIPEDSLGAHFASLAELGEHEDQLPAWMGMDNEFKLNERFPWLNTVESIAKQQGFFHWELQFARIFYTGGFDLQVGNPPWVRPRWIEAPILAEVEPWFSLADRPTAEEWNNRKLSIFRSGAAKLYLLRELEKSAGMLGFLGSSVAYEHLEGTQPDLYRAFMCKVWKNLAPTGLAGLVHPDTHFGGAKEGVLREAAYRHLRFHVHFSNQLYVFAEIRDKIEFGLHIYGAPSEIAFTHLSWAFSPSVIVESLRHDGSGELPGVKNFGAWDVRPHRERLIEIDENLLRIWHGLLGMEGRPVGQTPLLYPLTRAEAEAIQAIASYNHRLARSSPRISRGFDEARTRAAGLIRWSNSVPERLSDVVLQGPYLGIATPYAKQPNIPCRNNQDYSPWDLRTLPPYAIPVTNYEQVSSTGQSQRLLEQWDGRNYTEYYRLAWRRMIPLANERSLFPALIPPGPTHVHAVHSLALSNDRETVIAAGFWAALPIDYLLRITGKSDLQVTDASSMPTGYPEHPLAKALTLRTLRLNCLTVAYAALWERLYLEDWQQERWVLGDQSLPPLENVRYDWDAAIPLRSERERRAALVELDALVAVWIGLSVEQLVAIYRSRYPVLCDYESKIWFDVLGRKIAGNYNAYGIGQTKDDFIALQAHLEDPHYAPVPNGYKAPFYRADREAEYRQAHAVFSERLERAKAEGWTPDGEDSLA